MVGEMVGNYRILSELATGGMGAVYVAEHKHIGRRAAIKLLLPELSKKQDIIARFFDEARAASHVDHPGIVQIFDCDYHPSTGQAYLVMELLVGATLRQRLAALQRPAKEDWAKRTALEIARPLAAAHAKGIVHRDLKPENVFLVEKDRTETVKVLDFGVAKLGAALRVKTTNTLEGSILGTPLYMAPEQCRGSRTLDGRADVYALGCMLFEMVCNRPPFTGDSPTALIAAHLTEAPPDPRSLTPGLSNDLASLIVSMLAKDPAERPQTMDEVIARLSDGQESHHRTADSASGSTMILPAANREAGAMAAAAGSSAVAHSTTLSETASESPAVSRPSGGWWSRNGKAAGVGLAIAGAGVAIFVASGRPPSPSPGAGVFVNRPTPTRENPGADLVNDRKAPINPVETNPVPPPGPSEPPTVVVPPAAEPEPAGAKASTDPARIRALSPPGKSRRRVEASSRRAVAPPVKTNPANPAPAGPPARLPIE